MEKQKSTQKTEKINFSIITKIFWKEQIFFYLLTTFSAIINYVMDINVAEIIQKIIEKKMDKGIAFKFFNHKLLVFQEKNNFFWFMAFYIIFYCVIVIAHVYFAFYFANKVSRFLKGKISQKLFQLKIYNKQEVLANLNDDEKNFTYRVIHYPNQIYYLLLTFLLIFTGLWIAKKEQVIGNNTLLYGFIGFVLVAIVGTILSYFVYKKDLLLQKKAERIKKEENTLVNNRDLIIKKNLIIPYQKKYQQTINQNYNLADQRDWKFTLSLVIPSYSIVPYIEYIVLPLFCLVSGKYSYISLNMLSKIYNQEKKMLYLLKDYPYYFSAKKRLNQLFNQEIRNDEQKKVIITEPITSLTLKNVTFGYQYKKWVLKDFDLTFLPGKINRLEESNGFGKSTIVNLVMGLYLPNQGEILINDQYKLSEINLNEWRKKIAYAEHQNLIENGLSTGQKQLIDLENLLANSKSKEIFIFDEADNSLDRQHKKEFQQKLKKLSEKKMVILISH